VKVGVLGDKNYRPEGEATNSMIGMVHEFGSVKRQIPIRSWLRMPLYRYLNKRIEEDSKLKSRFEDITTESAMLGVLARIGFIAEDIIQEAFETCGFGTWRKLKSGGPSHLIDTGELRKSVTSEVVK
jgi:hypothetical protein